SALPLTAHRLLGEAVRIDDPSSSGVANVRPLTYAVSPKYFSTMRVPILAGRDFSVADDAESDAVVINRLLAERLSPKGFPLGKQLIMGDARRTVVGIVGDIRTRSLGDTAIAQVYLPLLASGSGDGAFVIRGEGSTSQQIAALREAVRVVDPRQAVFDARRMDEIVSDSVAPQRLNALLLSVFGAIGIVLSATGIYGLQAYNVARRRRDIGIRRALGASTQSIYAMVLKEAVQLAVVGVAIGIAGAVLVTRLLTSALYGVSSGNAIVLATSTVVLAIAAIVASWLPAVRATRIDPLEAIKSV
ncbi:MAG TPA: FtsX-like permease family protein, partial [Gemmatimonadaceae bacterium]